MHMATEYDAPVMPGRTTILRVDDLARGQRRFAAGRTLADMRRNLQYWSTKHRPRKFEGYEGEDGAGRSGVWVYRIR